MVFSPVIWFHRPDDGGSKRLWNDDPFPLNHAVQYPTTAVFVWVAFNNLKNPPNPCYVRTAGNLFLFVAPMDQYFIYLWRSVLKTTSSLFSTNSPLILHSENVHSDRRYSSHLIWLRVCVAIHRLRKPARLEFFLCGRCSCLLLSLGAIIIITVINTKSGQRFYHRV